MALSFFFLVLWPLGDPYSKHQLNCLNSQSNIFPYQQAYHVKCPYGINIIIILNCQSIFIVKSEQQKFSDFTALRKSTAEQGLWTQTPFIPTAHVKARQHICCQYTPLMKSGFGLQMALISVSVCIRKIGFIRKVKCKHDKQNYRKLHLKYRN